MCSPISAGEYYIVISGTVDRPTFSIDVTIDDVATTAGSATSTFNNQDVCSEAMIQVNANAFVLPGNASCGQDIAWFYSTNSTFNPYNNEGTYAASGTTNVDIPLPANTTCSSLTYFIKGIVSDDGISAVAGCQNTTNSIIVNVFPEIGLPTIVNDPCIIQVAARCPNFTVNGNPSSDTYLATFADDGLNQSFVISNGLAACNETFTETISCSGNCTQPTATGSVICDPNDPFNFYVEINFTPGSANSYSIIGSDGSALLVNSIGTYTAGPFSNDNAVIISIENTEDPNCNLPLGSFVDNCNPETCPNLTSALAPSSGDACVGEQVLLQATVDQGVLNVDYSAQWFLNGSPILNANTLNYLHTFSTLQGCSSEFQVFSVEITCLNPDAAASTSSSMTLGTGGFNVYPIPQLGVDFYPDPQNCIVAPIDNCGGLNISYSPTMDLIPGNPNATITYTASIPGAPAGCETTGTYQVQCPDNCGDNVGNLIYPANNVICHGESFNLELTGTSLEDYHSLGYAVTTTNPFNDLEGAVNTAVLNGDVVGPYAAGDIPTFTNGIEYTNGTYYFIPFSSLDINSGTVVWTTSGSFSVSAPFQGGSASFTIPQLPYCPGVTEYSMNIVIDQTQNESNLNAIDGMNSPIWNGPGGSTDFYNNTVVYTNDPSNTNHTINASGNFFWGSNINYTVTATYNVNNSFPTLCPSCTDISSAFIYELLPEVILTPSVQPIVCENSLFDLTTINPSANINGTYNWYDNDPAMGGPLLSNTEVLIPSGGATYWVEFLADADATCTEVLSVSITTTASPILTTPPTPSPICSGDIVDLTVMNNSISGGQAGNIVWFRGNPETDPFAVQLTDAIAANQTPTDGTTYFAVFTDAGTGCSSQVSVTYSVLPLPTMTPPVVNPSVCIGDSYDLSILENSLTTNTGTFAWYEGNPNAGGVLLTNTSVSPNNSTTYCAVFTDGTSNCQNTVCISLDVNPLPVLNTIPPQGPLCQGDEFELTTINSLFTTTAGTFTWYEGNPNTGGTLINNTLIVPSATIVYYVLFTETLTGCQNTSFVTFLIEATPSLIPPNSIEICAGESIDLTTLESGITANNGSFEWYEGDPTMGGTLVTDPNNVNPNMNTTYHVVFTTNTNCSSSTFVNVTVHSLPILNMVGNQGVCEGGIFDLSSLHSSLTTENGTFDWYSNGTLLTNLSITPSGQEQYDVIFTDANGCTASSSVSVEEYVAVTGATAMYDCTINQLVVDISNASGGSGMGYVVANNSPNQDGETLANGSNWTIIIVDDAGCEQVAITGTVNCIECNAGVASTTDPTTLCCEDMLQVNLSNEALSAGNIIAYGITNAADGPITNEADLSNAIIVEEADANNGFSFTHDCTLNPGDYYITPFISEEPDGITELMYDTLNGCTPNGEFCPIINGTGWILDPLIIHFPDGSFLNVNDDQAFGLPITPELLDAFGGIPCLTLTDLYSGDPNGVWWFEINNVGTGDLEFSTPAFDVVVDGSTCTALNGVDQVVTVDPINGTVIGGTTDSIGFELPPATSFPSIDFTCEDYADPILITLNDVTSSMDCWGTAHEDIQENISSFSVYPNPSNHLFNIELELRTSAKIQLIITDILGKEIKAETHSLSSGTFIHSIDLENYSSGIYLLSIQSEQQIISKKLIKK